VTIKVGGVETLGQVAVIDSVYPGGLLLAAHRHDGEDEMFYGLAGAVELSCATTAGPPAAATSRPSPAAARTGFTVVGGSRRTRWLLIALAGSTSRSPAPESRVPFGQSTGD
jgi:hypothetical protein